MILILEYVTLTATIKKNMSASTKLSTAVKALSYLAESYPEPKSSYQISKHIGANASKIRLLLSMLAKQQIVESGKGTMGGFLMRKNPSVLHMQEIYCAIEDRKAFHLHVTRADENTTDRTARFNNYFLDLFAEVQVDIEDKMRKITLIKIMNQLGIKSNFNK
ncbi:MAG: Rrf2 family transcriptional regulator [bacterium]